MERGELRAILLRFTAALCRDGDGTLRDRGGVDLGALGFHGLCALTYDYEDEGDGNAKPDYVRLTAADLLIQEFLVDTYLRSKQLIGVSAYDSA